MTTTAVPQVDATQRIRTAGLLCLVAGLLGAAGGIYLALRTPVVSEEMWSYPQGPGEFATTQLFFAVKDVGLILGLMALWWCGAVPRTRLGRIGQVVTMSGMVGLTITEVLAIIPLRQTVDSTAAGTMGALYGLGTIVVGVGLIIAGIAAARDGAWTGWRRWLPLVLGVWLFVPTMPALFLDFTAARLALVGWVLLFALLGWVLWHPTLTDGERS